MIPHTETEREKLLRVLVLTHKCVENSGDAKAIQSFQWLREFVERSHLVGRLGLVQDRLQRRFNA